MKAVVREDTFNILLQARSKEKTNGGGGEGESKFVEQNYSPRPVT